MMVFLIVYSIGISFALAMLGYVSVKQLHKEIGRRFDAVEGVKPRNTEVSGKEGQ